MTKCILVTGGAGFIGSALVRHLIATTDATIINVDKLTYAGNLESLAGAGNDPRHRFERVDIADAPAIRHLFATCQPDAVIHLAAESHVDRSIDGPEAFVRTNVLGTFVLLHEAREYWRLLPASRRDDFRFVQVSTDEVFGSLGAEGRFSEGSRYNPTSPYAATKAGADHLVRAWQRTYGFPAIITNCSNNYGPYQFPDKLIPLTLINAIEGRPLPLYGDGEQMRDWLFVDDHVQALVRVLTHGTIGETYLVGTGETRTNRDVVAALCELLDTTGPRPGGGAYAELIQPVTDRPGHDLRYAVDASRTRRALGWQPATTLADGLRATTTWYLENRVWWQRARAAGYAGERLGLDFAGNP